jgi:hypothetical protein
MELHEREAIMETCLQTIKDNLKTIKKTQKEIRRQLAPIRKNGTLDDSIPLAIQQEIQRIKAQYKRGTPDAVLHQAYREAGIPIQYWEFRGR